MKINFQPRIIYLHERIEAKKKWKKMNAKEKKRMFTFNNIQNISIIKILLWWTNNKCSRLHTYYRRSFNINLKIFFFLINDLEHERKKLSTLRVWFNLIDMWKEIFAITTRDEKYFFFFGEPLQRLRIEMWKLIPAQYVNDFCRFEKL